MRGRILAAAVLLSLSAAPAYAHQGNPNMESVVRSVQPHVGGMSLDVLNRDDRFELVNRTGKTIVIDGYSGEPYARVLADGTVEVNTNSPAYYLNDDRYANVKVPPGASSKAEPAWKQLDKTGRFQWHDHRMHYMATGVPPQVKDRSKRQKVFDYRIPIRIGSTEGAILGTLFWTPQKGGGPPAIAIAALAALLIASLAAVVVARRRRPPGGGGDDAEAW